MDPRTALRQSGLFGVLDDASLDEITALGVVERFASGARILTEGERGDSLHVILDGSVEVFHDVDGEMIVFATLGPGSHVGELALLVGNGRRTASVRAYTDVVLLRIDHEELGQVLSADASLRERLESLGKEQLTHSLAQRSLLLRAAVELGVEPTIHIVEKGDVLFHQGDKADAAYAILEGTAAVYRDGRETPMLLRRIVEGQLVGERAALSRSVRTATVRAETRLTLLRIEAADLKRLTTDSRLWREHVQTLERIYMQPRRGFIIQHSARVQGVPSIVTTYDLGHGRKLVVTRLVGQLRVLIETPGVEIAQTIRWGPTALDLDINGVLRGADAVGRRTTLSRLVQLTLDEQVLTPQQRRTFERDGVLPAEGRD